MLVKFPGIHVYVDAPFAVIVLLEPAHKADPKAAAVVIDGSWKTNTVKVTVETAPLPQSPVTVKVVVLVSDTVIELLVKFPGIQVYVVAPLAFNVTEFPAQIELLDEVRLKVQVGIALEFEKARMQNNNNPKSFNI